MKTKAKPTVNEKIQKLFNIEVKSIDEDNRTVRFCFSDDSVDRYGEIVDQKTWDLASYKKNPIILWGHNGREAENVIGTGSDIELDVNGKSFITAQFDDDDKSNLIFNKIKKGILRCVSAGFIPHSLEWQDDVPVLKDNELLEVSVVAIPANRNAVALDYKAGEMKLKDADFLIKSMRDEADALEAAVRAAEGNEEGKSTEELQAELDAAVARAEEAEAKVAELEAAGSGDEHEEEEHEDEGEEEDQENPANGGGDDDQSGAADELDLDAEVTDELLDQEVEEPAAA